MVIFCVFVWHNITVNEGLLRTSLPVSTWLLQKKTLKYLSVCCLFISLFISIYQLSGQKAHNKISFYAFSRINIHTVKIFILKDPCRKKRFMKWRFVLTFMVSLNYLKLLNIYKNQNLSFFWFKKKTMVQCLLWTLLYISILSDSCISKLKELQLLFFLENSF